MADGKKVILNSDNPSLQISPIKLDGTNYLAWSRSCLLFIKARGMQGYITGASKKPAANDDNFNQWDSENSLVMSWLINSMQPQISKTYLLLDTAVKIWNAATLTYSRVGNDAQIFEIRNKVHGIKQGELTISQFFSELSGLWQELDYYQDFQADCTADAVKFQKLIEKERVYDFLAGLNNEYDQIRIQVLGKVPFPTLEEAFSYVQQEESRRSAMLYTVPTEKTGLAASGPHDQTNTHSLDKANRYCDYCGKPRHTKETYWKLHGRPTRGRGGKRVNSSRPQANMVEILEPSSETSSSPTLSSDDIHHLKRLLSHMDSSSSGAKSNFV